MGKVVLICIFSTVVHVVSSQTFVFADDTKQEVTVRVRMVQADGASGSALKHFSQFSSGNIGAHDVVIDRRIKDLSYKLKELPYHTYTLVSSKRVEVPMKERQTISLRGGQFLNLRLLYVERNRTGMWLRWEDSAGTELLDTRMHFSCSESMVTGTENGKDSGLILAVNVENPEKVKNHKEGAGQKQKKHPKGH